MPYLVDRESVSADRLSVYDNYLRGNTYWWSSCTPVEITNVYKFAKNALE